ncbi:MAG: indolepyruvate ferredoxin oxidoreductase subunit alpha [Armatimonadota bacterium]
MNQSVSKKKFLSGNEAIAQAAYVAGVRVAAAYPGTPSTEILENIAEFPEIYCEWSVNEKVAMEVGIGASFAGARALVAMKHVGLNVALDPLMTFAYIGATGGLVIISADDPGMHSSQNEQDNRMLAKFARIPLLEPSDSQECYDMLLAAYDISEQFELPVIVRTTTRISHSSGIVNLENFERRHHSEIKYTKDISRTVMVPLFARQRRVALEQKLERLRAFSEKFPMHRSERPQHERAGELVGVITSGVAYAYVKEELPNVSILKLGISFPLPEKLIRDFAASVDRLYVVEEGDPFIEEQVMAMGLPVQKPNTSLRIGELSPDRLKLLSAEIENRKPEPIPEPMKDLPARPPVLCPGCAHRGIFYSLNRLKATVMGDIGCYSLGAFEPLYAMDSIVCMGASIGNAHGMEKAGYKGRLAAIIGDSTFFHSGITGLLNTVYNRGTSTVIVLDNRTTAMTGHQEHPGTGRTLMGEETFEARVEDVAGGIGVKNVVTVDPYDLANTHRVLKEELDRPEPSVVVSRRECVLRCRERPARKFAVDEALCRACGACLRLGCPAIEIDETHAADSGRPKVRINDVLCAGCGLCMQVCKFEAIKEIARQPISQE